MSKSKTLALVDIVLTIALTGFAIRYAITGQWGWFWANVVALAVGLPFLRARVAGLKRVEDPVEGNPYENVGQPHMLGTRPGDCTICASMVKGDS